MTASEVSASYRPGEWFGIFGEHVTVVLPPSEKARVARIWTMADEGAGFDEVLDALIADGLRQLPGFVLVSESDGQTTVVIRGPARAEFVVGDETVVVEGSSVTTWAERSLREVSSMRVEVADDAGAPDLVIDKGLVRVSRIDRPAYAAVVDQVTDVTPERLPAVDDPAEQVEETAFFPELASPDTPPPVGNWHVGPVARLAFSTGEMVDVDRRVVVGRAPVERHPELGEPRLVAVVSPQQEISSTHLEVRPGTGSDVGSAFVTDLGSTNGTVLQQPGLTPEDLTPGVAVRLLPGAVIDLGDGVTIRVDSP